MTRKAYTITNMICPACVNHLEALEDELEGILFIKANYRKQHMELEFDESRISEGEIRAAIAELGYEIG
jgi:copper chaperone CopZ